MSAFGEAQLAEVPRPAGARARAQQLALTPDLRHALVLEKCSVSGAGGLPAFGA
jgi:hypothetical protein